MQGAWDGTKARVRTQLYRIWTAAAVLGAYVYGWWRAPELLVWWKRTTDAVVQAGCGVLPYPWGDRVESTLGDFGLWVQVTLAILAFRVLVWAVMGSVGGLRGLRHRRRR